MDRYLPTGNEMISLPKINQQTAGIEDFTYLSMQHKGLIEIRGTDTVPLMEPFFFIEDQQVRLSCLNWSREYFWIPTLRAKLGKHDFSMTILTPVGERGFGVKLSVTGGEEGEIRWGLRGCWGSSWHCINEDK